MEQQRRPKEADEYTKAFATVRTAKNWFWWLIVVSLLVQIAAFLAVHYGKVLDRPPEATVATQAASGPAVAIVGSAAAPVWENVLSWALPATKFIALVASILLAVALVLATKLSLVGRLGGAAGFVSAFFWSVLVLVFLVPWQQVLPESSYLCGATYNLGDLLGRTGGIAKQAKTNELIPNVLFFCRFLAYPIFVLLLALIAQAKFAKGYRRMTLSVSAGPAGQAEESKI